MGKLSRNELTEGHTHVMRRNLEGLVSWARSLGIVTLDLDELESTFAKQFAKPEISSALRIFREYFCHVDRDVEYRRWRLDLLQWVIYSIALGIGVLWVVVRAKG